MSVDDDDCDSSALSLVEKATFVVVVFCLCPPFPVRPIEIEKETDFSNDREGNQLTSNRLTKKISIKTAVVVFCPSLEATFSAPSLMYPIAEIRFTFADLTPSNRLHTIFYAPLIVAGLRRPSACRGRGETCSLFAPSPSLALPFSQIPMEKDDSAFSRSFFSVFSSSGAASTR